MISGKLKYYGALVLLVFSLVFVLFYNTSPSEKNRLLIRNQIDSLNRLIPKDSAASFNIHQEEAFRLARKISDPGKEAEIYIASGDYYNEWNEFKSAIVVYDSAISIAIRYQLKTQEVNATCKKAGACVSDKNKVYAEKLYREILEKTFSWNDSVLVATCAEQFGIYFLVTKNYSKAIENFNVEYAFLDKDTAFQALGVYFSNMGIIYFNLAEYKRSVEYYQKGIVFSEKTNNPYILNTTRLNTAILYKDMGFYELAMELLLDALPYYDEKENKKQGLGSCLNTMATTYTALGDYEKALEYHSKSIALRKKDKSQGGLAFPLTNIGETYLLMKQYDLAIQNLRQSIKLKKEIKSDKLHSSLRLLGEVYLELNQTDTAEKYFTDALILQRINGDKKGEAITHNNLGKLYLKTARYREAAAHLDTARTLSRNISAKSVLLQNYELSVQAYKARSAWQEAVLLNDTLVLLRDSLFNDQKSKALAEMQVKYETEKVEQDNVLLIEKNKLQTEEAAKQSVTIYALFASAALLLLLAVFIGYAYRAKRKSLLLSNEVINQKQFVIEQKQNMLSELHHRIKNNLQVLASLLSLQQKRLTDETSREALRAVENRLEAMLLVHKGLYGKSVDGTIRIKDYMHKLSENLISSFGYERGYIKTIFQIEDLQFDADIALNAGFIANEIISNSLKHAFPGHPAPELHIRIWQEQTLYRFIFSDNGAGISQNINAGKEESFGLKLIRLFVDQMGATFEIQSGTTGTQFEINIPVSK